MAQLLKAANQNAKKTKFSLFAMRRFLKEKMFKDMARWLSLVNL